MECDDIVVQVEVTGGGCGKGLVGRERRARRLDLGEISPGQRRMESVAGDFLGLSLSYLHKVIDQH